MRAGATIGRTDIGAPVAADRANEPLLQIGQPQLIGP
jgi:hypothetical protein